MAARKPKPEIITFKADEPLLTAMAGIPNRSAFIRTAILAALDCACPLCGGTGVLSVDQRDHWRGFALDHSVEECGDCHELHLVCHGRTADGKRTGRRTRCS